MTNELGHFICYEMGKNIARVLCQSPYTQRVVVTVEDGVVTGVFTDNKDVNTLVTVIDYDNIASGDDDTEAITTEAQIETGILKRCY